MFSELEQSILNEMLERRPDLVECVPALQSLHDNLVRCYDGNGTLFTCGNGGSNSDAQHIVGELCKSFERKRPIPKTMKENLKGLPFGDELSEHLEAGLAAITLGYNNALKSAVENDSPMRDIAYAQELNALIQPGDVLIGISTSGNAGNCLMAMSVAKAGGGVAISLTGPKGGKMAEIADVAVKAPGGSTKVIQEAHLVLYHTICNLIEAHYFPELR